MNIKQLQEEYKHSKAELDNLDTMKSELEKQYIINKGITNADGSIPQAISDIMDNNAMYNTIADFAQHIEQNGLYEQITVAQDKYNKAGDNLIKYGLPIEESKMETLVKLANNHAYRMLLIDIALNI